MEIKKTFIKVPSELKYIRKASSEILNSLSKYGIDEDRLFDIRLCTEEAVRNAIIHGNRSKKKSSVNVQGSLVKDALIFKPNFLEAIYFSVITFTTVGYGDITPVGLTKLVAMGEVFCGIFVVPIFIVGLSRKYLRI